MKKNLLHVVFGTTMVIGALSLTALNVAKVEATNGNTTLTGTACNDTVAVAVYDIDFGAFAATDVLGTIKINAGTKSGTQRTPSNGSADYYVYVTNTCHTDNGWNVTIRATTMTGTVA